jgi:hypothetical protein
MGKKQDQQMILRLFKTAGRIGGLAVCLLTVNQANAQGLLFNMPEDGMAAEYEGKLTQAKNAGDTDPLTWTRELTIKSVGSEDAEYNGVVQPCRWIEIKITTGVAGAAGIDPGPVGARLYKVLVPESKVIPNTKDSDSIPNHMIPIVKGYRRLGEEAYREITASALRIYPTISLLTNYDEPETLAAAEVPDVLAQGVSVSARHMKGQMIMERADSRSTNIGEYWVSPEVPFGLARWIVTVTRESKETTAPREDFQVVSVVNIDMKLKRIRSGAESELVTN